jgi:thiamine biosynthesis lipoprotein
MPLQESLPVDVYTEQWPVWGTTARMVVTDPAVLPLARSIVDVELAAVDDACSRFRDDSELSWVVRAGGRPVRVSSRLAELVSVALAAAERTGGDVDPTVGAAMSALGYDRDFATLVDQGKTRGKSDTPPARLSLINGCDWRAVRLCGRELVVPQGMRLDLGATAKAFTADRCARMVSAIFNVGALVSLGGDLATAGPAPAGGWRVLVQDGPTEPGCTVTLPADAAIATSSTISRQWQHGGRLLHHILDPRTCQPAPRVWRTVSVAADRCLDANTFATAALVRGERATGWLRRVGAAARLVDADGRVTTLGRWPS